MLTIQHGSLYDWGMGEHSAEHKTFYVNYGLGGLVTEQQDVIAWKAFTDLQAGELMKNYDWTDSKLMNGNCWCNTIDILNSELIEIQDKVTLSYTLGFSVNKQIIAKEATVFQVMLTEENIKYSGYRLDAKLYVAIAPLGGKGFLVALDKNSWESEHPQNKLKT